MPREVAEKLELLDRILGELAGGAVAFSGGVDSTLLAHRCAAVLGESCIAVIVDSPFFPRAELSEAKALAAGIGIATRIARIGGVDGFGEPVLANPRDRCYLCKRRILALVCAEAKDAGISQVLEGSNADDLSDYRPGMRAVKELSVRSPLLEAGLSKADIRAISRELGLATWDKPAAACLASRIPYGRRISSDILERIEAGEELLKRRGIRQCRVRVHGEAARIEVSPDERARFFDLELMDELAGEFSRIGFAYAALDLEGYRTGKLNQ